MDIKTRLISFFSSKGGVGKSVMALNTAIVLSQKLKKKVLLVDADFEFGDICTLVDQHEAKNIMDMIDDNQYKSHQDILPYLYGYNENMKILFAPKKPESNELINEQMLKKIIDQEMGYYDYIIFDLAINFTEKSLYILDHSDYILYMTTMDFLALKNTKVGLDLMKNLSYTEDKVKLVLNGVNKLYGINLADVRDAFTQKIFAKIPEDIMRMRRSVNLGKPLATSYRQSRITKSIEKMCKDIIKLG